MNIGFIVAGALILGLSTGIWAVILIDRMRSSRHVPAQYNTTFVFSGNLKQTSLFDAIQFLEIGGREGILHIYSGRRKGYLTFSKGKVIDGFFRNKTGREAVFMMLGLEEGDFYFEPKKIVQPQLISDSIMDLAFTWDAQHSAGKVQPN
jgi:hypothetical protein